MKNISNKMLDFYCFLGFSIYKNATKKFFKNFIEIEKAISKTKSCFEVVLKSFLKNRRLELYSLIAWAVGSHIDLLSFINLMLYLPI